MKILHGHVLNINGAVRQVIHETRLATRRTTDDIEGRVVLHVLQECVYPNGSAEKPVSITKRDLDEHDPFDAFLLRRKIGKIDDSELFEFVRELANLPPAVAVEEHLGSALHVFISKRLIRKATKTRSGRWL